MTRWEIRSASAREMLDLRAWAEEEGWNPGDSDHLAFAVSDPHGFLIGCQDGEPVGCISAVRHGAGFGFIGFYIVRPHLRGRGYGTQVWEAGMDRLADRVIGLDGVVAQQEYYRKWGFASAWVNVRFEGRPAVGPEPPEGVVLVDATTVPFGQLAAYDRRFFPEPRDAFLAAWIGVPGRISVAALRGDELVGFGGIRPCSGTSRIGPLYAADAQVAAAVIHALAERAQVTEVALDVPDHNAPAVRLMDELGLSPGFETARMYRGEAPRIDRDGLFAVASLELG